MEKKITIIAGSVAAEATLANTATAEALWNALPLESTCNLWGDEIYFTIPISHALEHDGVHIVHLEVGEPDFDTPEHIRDAAIRAIQAGQTRYTAVDGTPELKQAIIDKFRRDNGLEFGADQVIASNGAKQSLYNLMVAVLNRGDEVIVPAPYWVSYPDMVKLADGQPAILNCTAENEFKITARQLQNTINENTRMLILNSPSNPTGKVYSEKEFREIGEVLCEHPKILIACDDIYEFIYWGDKPFRTFLNACPELEERTVVINGVSKGYAMTGWRIGYLAGPEDLVRAMRKVQGQSTSCPGSVSQAAAVAALNGPQFLTADGWPVTLQMVMLGGLFLLQALLVFSDGEDQGSRVSRQDALEAARRSHASVYAVGLVGWSADAGMHTNQALLEEIARSTGGRAFFPEKEKEMRKAFDQVLSVSQEDKAWVIKWIKDEYGVEVK